MLPTGLVRCRVGVMLIVDGTGEGTRCPCGEVHRVGPAEEKAYRDYLHEEEAKRLVEAGWVREVDLRGIGADDALEVNIVCCETSYGVVGLSRMSGGMIRQAFAALLITHRLGEAQFDDLCKQLAQRLAGRQG